MLPCYKTAFAGWHKCQFMWQLWQVASVASSWIFNNSWKQSAWSTSVIGSQMQCEHLCRWHNYIVSCMSIQLSGWIIWPNCGIRSRFSNDNKLWYDCAAFVCLSQICNWEHMILSGKWSWCQWHDYKWKYTIASDSESGTFIIAAEQNASILARSNKGNTALMEVLCQHVFAAAPFWSTCQML